MKPAILATNEIEKPININPLPDITLVPVIKPVSGIGASAVKPIGVSKPMSISAQIETSITKPVIAGDPADTLIEQERAGSIQLVPLASRIIDTINRFHDHYNS